MAFPVRKRRQIGQLAFLLLWLRTRRSGVRVPPPVRLVDFFGCIGCNNAALSRELKANAHLFGYLFAERHVSLRLFEAEGKAVAYPIRENEVDNIWVQPLDGSRGRQITNFDSEQILNFRWSPDGKSLCILRGHTDSDFVLLQESNR